MLKWSCLSSSFELTSIASIFGKEMPKERNIQIVRNDQCPPPKFIGYTDIKMTQDAPSDLSPIPPRVFIVHVVRSCNMCKVTEIGDYEMWASYDKLCDNGNLKDENKIIAINCALALMKVFKVEWINIFLS